MQGKHSLLLLLTLITRQRLQFLLLDGFLLSLARDHFYGEFCIRRGINAIKRGAGGIVG